MSKFKTLFDNTQVALRDQPAAAAISFETEGRLVDGFRSEVQARQFQINADEPEALGGEDTAPNPVEYLLAALSTCQEITYRLYADALGIPVDGISVKLKGDLDNTEFSDLDIPLFTNVDAKAITSGAEAKDALERQVVSPVRWEAIIDGMVSAGVRRFVELGPGKVLSGLVRKIAKDVETFSVSSPKGIERLREASLV